MMRFLFALSILLGLCFPAAPSMARTEPSLILELAPGASIESLNARGFGRFDPLFPAHRDPLDPLSRFHRLTLADTRVLSSTAAALAMEPTVVSSWVDEVSPLAGCLPNDPYFMHAAPDSAQWPIHANPQGPDLGALDAWNVTTGDPDVVLAILDSGVDWHHPEFGPPLSPAGQIWMNVAEASGQAGVDDDGNGFVDDVRGWDFVDVSTIPGESNRVDPAEDGFVPDNDPVDYDGHGTFVAGIAGAAMDDGVGMAGLAPGVRLQPLRVGWREEYIDTGTGRRVTQGVVAMSFCAQAIVYAADNGARVLNCSWLSTETPELKAALDYAIAVKGVLVVDAAGNGGLSITQSQNYLSRRGDCLEVAALDPTGQVSAVSSIGTWVDLSAPGEKLLSLVKTGVSRLYRINNDGATSFAAPFVSATAALVRSVAPGMTPAQVRTHLMANARNVDNIGFNTFYAGKLGAGMVSPARALEALVPAARESIDAPIGSAPLVLAGSGFIGVDSERHVVDWSYFTESHRSRLPLDGEIRGVASVMNGPSRIDVVTLREGHVAVLKDGAFAAGWPRPTGGLILGNPMIVELGGGADPEIVVAGTDSLLYAWSLDGTSRPGFPVRLPDAALTAPAAGDVIPGGAVEIVVVTADDRVSIVTSGGVRTDWSSTNPTPLAGARYAAPALADVTGDGRLDVVLTGADRIGALPNPAGSGAGILRESLLGDDPLVGEVAVADLDGDGLFGVVTTHVSGVVAIRTPVVFPPTSSSLVLLPSSGSPATAALVFSPDGLAGSGIVVITTDGCLEAFGPTGDRLPGWPKRLTSNATGRAAAGPDITPNTIGLVVETAGGELRRFTIPSADPIGDTPWGMAGGNAQRTRSVAPTLPASPMDPETPDQGNRPIQFAASPNPVGVGTPVAFRLSGAVMSELVIHDIQGRVVRRLPVALNDKSSDLHWWDGRSDAGRLVSAGLYLGVARLDDGAVRTARIVVVR